MPVNPEPLPLNAVALTVPLTSKADCGFVEPMPTLSEEVVRYSFVPLCVQPLVLEIFVSPEPLPIKAVAYAVPLTSNTDRGLADPMPTLVVKFESPEPAVRIPP